MGCGSSKAVLTVTATPTETRNNEIIPSDHILELHSIDASHTDNEGSQVEISEIRTANTPAATPVANKSGTPTGQYNNDIIIVYIIL